MMALYLELTSDVGKEAREWLQGESTGDSGTD